MRQDSSVHRRACRLLLDKKQQKHKGAQEVLAALSFLEVEERTGRATLDVTEFRYVISRFCELARLDPDEVPFLLHTKTLPPNRWQQLAAKGDHACAWHLRWASLPRPGGRDARQSWPGWTLTRCPSSCTSDDYHLVGGSSLQPKQIVHVPGALIRLTWPRPGGRMQGISSACYCHPVACRLWKASSSWQLPMRSGTGPSLKEAMEKEVNEQVGLPPSRAASQVWRSEGSGMSQTVGQDTALGKGASCERRDSGA